jgi:hypothetical protein
MISREMVLLRRGTLLAQPGNDMSVFMTAVWPLVD